MASVEHNWEHLFDSEARLATLLESWCESDPVNCSRLCNVINEAAAPDGNTLPLVRLLNLSVASQRLLAIAAKIAMSRAVLGRSLSSTVLV